MRSRKEIISVIEKGLERTFAPETISVVEGYGDNVRVKVVSKKFDGMSDLDAVEYLWKSIEETGLAEEEKALISLVLPVGLMDV